MATTDYTNGVTLTDAGEFERFDCAAYAVLSGVAGTNTITATGPATYTLAATRPPVWFIPAVTNTGATTINITPSGGAALGATNIFAGGAALVGGELVAGIPVGIVYDGVRFQLLSHVPIVDTRPAIIGGTDATKKVRFEVDGLTTGTTRVVTVPDRNITLNTLELALNALGSDVALNNTANFFDGPSAAASSSGTWLVTGNVTLVDTAGAATFAIKLHDGTTTLASGLVRSSAANEYAFATISAYAASPAGNLRISVKDITSTSGKIVFNDSGLQLDSVIHCVRVA